MSQKNVDALSFGIVFTERAALSRIEVSKNGVPCPDAKVRPFRPLPRPLSNWQPSQELLDDIHNDLAKMHQRDAEFFART